MPRLRRPLSIAAVGALSVGLAACGQSSRLVSTPTTTVAAPPLSTGNSGSSGSSGSDASSPTSSGSTTTVTTTASRAAGTRSGTADVAYAGSLQLLNEKVTGPAFAKATGYSYSGMGAGAIGLAKEIVAGEISPNVFESIGTQPVATLEPKFTSWYVQVAASPIVVTYNPHSAYASQLAAIAKGTKPLSDLFTLLETPGFTLGRTDPNTDPQGQAFYEMVELAQSSLHLPSDTVSKVLGGIDNAKQIFAETALEARLQGGQLDAASAYRSQAVQLKLPYITLPTSISFGDPSMAATYATASLKLSDGTTVHGSPLVVDITTVGTKDAAAADAFVAYVLSSAGRGQLSSGGYTLLPETAGGNASAIPATVRDAISGS